MRTPDDLRLEARRLIAACKTTPDPARKKRYAARAFKLAQLAEQLCRKDQAEMPVRGTTERRDATGAAPDRVRP